MSRWVRWFLFLSILLQAATLAVAQDASVVTFTPTGLVKSIRQVRAAFSAPMVALGDPRGARLAPFEIACSQAGEESWSDPKTWVYNFAQDLKGDAVCEFKLKAGLRSLAGGAVTGEPVYRFTTGGPSLLSIRPPRQPIPEDAAFAVFLDAKVDPASIAANVYFEVQGIQERIPARVIAGAEREKIVAALTGSRRFLADEEEGEGESAATPEIVVVQAQRPFPPKSKARLVWGRGVSGANGGQTPVDQTREYDVRDDFRVSFSCERENRDAACIPMLPLRVEFSAPVPGRLARQMRLTGPGGFSRAARLGENAEKNPDGAVDALRFEPPFPPETAFTLALPPGLTDDAGRAPVNRERFPMEVKSAALPPLAKFAAEFGIVERSPLAALPVTLRNLEATVEGSQGAVELAEAAPAGEKSDSFLGQLQSKVTGLISQLTGADPGDRVRLINEWMYRVMDRPNDKRDVSVFAAGAGKLAQQAIVLPKPHGAKAFEVVGIPLPKPGFYVVELKSELLGKSLLGADKPMYVASAALVTDLSVHLKASPEAALVWVTALGTGKPVAGAAVGVWDCSGKRLGGGATDAGGRVPLATLPEPETCNRASLHHRGGFFVTAVKEDDFAFVHSSWNEGIETWRFNLPTEYSPFRAKAKTRAWSVLDRPLFRAGETVHMKHFLRREVPTGFAALPPDQLPARVRITHGGSEEQFETAAKWRDNAVGESEWNIPKEAKLGHYAITATVNKETVELGSFRVEEFRVPLLKASVLVPAQPPAAATEATVDLMASYLAGGPAANLPVTLRYGQARAPAARFGDFPGFEFATGPVPEERRSGEDDGETSLRFTRVPGTLGEQGSARMTLGDLMLFPVPSRVSVEMDFLDPNGEVQTAGNAFTVYPAARLAGLNVESWLVTPKGVRFKAAVANTAGKPVARAAVQVEWIARRVYSHRVRLVGGFYGYQQRTEMQRLGKACSGLTNERGLLECSVRPPATGNVYLEARVTDGAGNRSLANASMWVSSDDAAWFEQQDHDRMDVLPVQKSFEPGQTARFQVRMPFREATALITVEREGVLESFVRPIKADNPVVEVPIKPHYAPNVFVSVLAVRGRVGGVQPTALVDLGRPAYKLGIAEINVGWKAYQLNVKVTPARPVYKVREHATVRLQVTHADGTRFAGGEAAVAVVDEGLLELGPNGSWALLDAMMSRRSSRISTSTAQGRVIGKRHFGLKALAGGGGGGRSATRELFDTLLFWNGNVKLDEDGGAAVSFPLSDAVTGFRVVAVAHGGAAKFGTGQASIRSSQELTLFPGVAPLVREGDLTTVEFTARNAGPAPVTATVSGQVSPAGIQLPERRIALAPGAAAPVRWRLAIPLDARQLTYEVEAKGAGGAVLDRVKAVQRVAVAVPVQTIQATLIQADPSVSVPVQRPADALPGRGGIRAVVEPGLSAAADGVNEYMDRYPYVCLEQQASAAVALQSLVRWQLAMRALPAYLDHDGLAKFFPSDWLKGSPVLTAYVLSIGHAAGWEIPAFAKERMLKGLEAFVQGKIFRAGEMPAPDLLPRRLAGMEALARFGRVTPDLAATVEPAPGLWPTSAVLDWHGVLKRTEKIPNRERLMREASDVLRGRMTYQGTLLKFSSEASDGLYWLLASADQNAVRALLLALEDPAWKDDVPKIMRGALSRMRGGHWDTTLANAWGRLAVMKFAAANESQKPSGATALSLGGRTETVEWGKDPAGKSVDLPWPESGVAPGDFQARHQGDGRPWITVQSRAAIPLKEPFSSGYRIVKTVTPVERKRPRVWSRGDLARVTLQIDAQTDMTWVVVNDPIPAGATVMGSGLGRGTALAGGNPQAGGTGWDSAQVAYVERSFEGYRAYYSYLPKGTLKVEYVMRLNQTGTFKLPPTRVEAMYAPENLGLVPNPAWQVGE